MHKLLAGLLFSLTLLVFGTSVVFAAGQVCCRDGFSYNAANQNCERIWYSPGAFNPTTDTQPLNCNSGENCLGLLQGGPIRGICSESSSTTGCCTGRPGATYDPATKTCTHEGTLACTSDQFCAASNDGNFCISGTNNSVPDFNMCEGISDAALRQKCGDCMGDDETSRGVWTGLGCIKTSPKDFIADFLKIALGIAGGLALLLMVFGAFQITISAGDPKKATEGREIIQGAIAGLLFIIFSVVLLHFIGVDILNIPGL